MAETLDLLNNTYQQALGLYTTLKGVQYDEDTLNFAKEANAMNIALTQEQNELNRQSQERINQANVSMADRINAMQIENAKNTNDANIALADRTNAQNLAIANQNLAFQRDVQKYNENLQNEIFKREDNSYQRTINDMMNAGMSPLAMSGLNGSGSVVGMTPMENNMNYMAPTLEKAGDMQMATQYANKYERAKFEKIEKSAKELEGLYRMSDNINALESRRLEGKRINVELNKLAQDERYHNAMLAERENYHNAYMDESKRHNKKMEEFGSAKNRILNMALDWIQGKGADTANKTVSKVQAMRDKATAEAEKKYVEAMKDYYKNLPEANGKKTTGNTKLDLDLKMKGILDLEGGEYDPNKSPAENAKNGFKFY